MDTNWSHTNLKSGPMEVLFWNYCLIIGISRSYRQARWENRTVRNASLDLARVWLNIKARLFLQRTVRCRQCSSALSLVFIFTFPLITVRRTISDHLSSSISPQNLQKINKSLQKRKKKKHRHIFYSLCYYLFASFGF